MIPLPTNFTSTNFTIVPRHVCAKTRLCPQTFVPTHFCAQTRLCPDMFVPRHVCSHTCLCPRKCAHAQKPTQAFAHESSKVGGRGKKREEERKGKTEADGMKGSPTKQNPIRGARIRPT